MEPREFAESILREHEAHREAASGPWRWGDDPDRAALVALAAIATRWSVTAAQFEAKLTRLSRTPTGAARSAAERLLTLWREQRAAQAPAQRPTVLVVEDDESIQELIRVILEDDYELVIAATAGEALDAARRACPDAITLDLMLPDGHGARLLVELKADPATAQIPVVVMSAYTGGLLTRHRALANRIVHKPFGPLELLDAVAAVVKGRASGIRALDAPDA